MSELYKIICEDDPRALVALAEREGRAMSKGQLSLSQIRNVFSRVRQIQASWRTNRSEAERQLQLLRPRLGYQLAREEPRKREGIQRLQSVLTEAIDMIYIDQPPVATVDERFKRFVDLFEAILAYHRVQEEKTKEEARMKGGRR